QHGLGLLADLRRQLRHVHGLGQVIGRHEIGAVLLHERDGLVVEHRAVLDRVHAGAHRGLDSLGSVGVGRHLEPWRWASVTSATSSSSEYCCAPTGPSKESTPAVAQVLMTLAPYLICARTAAITWSTPSATPLSGPRSRM